MSKYNCSYCSQRILDCHINKKGFVVFMKPTCPYSINTMKTIINLNENYVFYDINDDSCKYVKKILQKYLNKSSFTVPQVFYNGKYIGGNDDLQRYLQHI